jgi:mono/diheme cytochrome c family protein
MGKFIAGMIFVVLCVVVGGFAYTWLGYFPLNADARPPALEKALGSAAFDRTVEKRAPKVENPVKPTVDNLNEGMAIYVMDCAVCHGAPNRTTATVGLYPPAPQFTRHAPDMPDNETFWIIKHGARYTGMPSWDKTMTEDQIWKVTTFLGSWTGLPPEIKAKFGDTGQKPEHE